jgi:hypothetical protein
MTKQVEIGDKVGCKYDIEQTGEVVKIEHTRYDGTVYHVRCTQGEYCQGKAVVVPFNADEIW